MFFFTDQRIEIVGSQQYHFLNQQEIFQKMVYEDMRDLVDWSLLILQQNESNV